MPSGSIRRLRGDNRAGERGVLRKLLTSPDGIAGEPDPAAAVIGWGA
jgi:hypothetical protein